MQRIAQQLYDSAGSALVKVILAYGEQGLPSQPDEQKLKDFEAAHQADLRRAASTAYYAVFHALIEASVDHIAGNAPPSVQAALARSFEHSSMKGLESVLKRPPLDGVFANTPDELKNVIKHFKDLQDARHTADYDLSLPFGFLQANRAIEMMWSVFLILDKHKLQPVQEIEHFLILLPVAGKLQNRLKSAR